MTIIPKRMLKTILYHLKSRKSEKAFDMISVAGNTIIKEAFKPGANSIKISIVANR